jgi:hypothetical protein
MHAYTHGGAHECTCAHTYTHTFKSTVRLMKQCVAILLCSPCSADQWTPGCEGGDWQRGTVLACIVAKYGRWTCTEPLHLEFFSYAPVYLLTSQRLLIRGGQVNRHPSRKCMQQPLPDLDLALYFQGEPLRMRRHIPHASAQQLLCMSARGAKKNYQ